MEIKLSSMLDCHVEQALQQVMRTRLLLYVARPLVVFKPVQPSVLPDVWSEGRYQVEMFVFGFIPFGKQWIVISIDEKKYQLRDSGYGDLISTWDHLISMQHIGNLYQQSDHSCRSMDTCYCFICFTFLLVAAEAMEKAGKKWF